MKRRYRIITEPDYPNYLLQVLTSEAGGDYPEMWTFVGRYENIPEAKKAAAERSERLDLVERLKLIPPEEFEA